MPYSTPKATLGKRPSTVPATRSRNVARLVIILAVVLGIAALLAIALAGFGVIRDSLARSAIPTPPPLAEPTTEVSPTPMMVIQSPSDASPPTATATELPPTSAPLPTDTPPPPTETPAPQPTDTPATRRVTYTVQQGDSCWAIATRFNITLNDLIRLNNLTTDCLIRPGQELVITP